MPEITKDKNCIIKLNINNPQIGYLIAKTYLYFSYDRALKLKPRDSNVWNNKGLSFKN